MERDEHLEVDEQPLASDVNRELTQTLVESAAGWASPR